MSDNGKKIGLITSTSLVVGNMIGAGIFLLPATLAKYGSISLMGWLFTAAGALILAKIFSGFSTIIVNKSGGPYTYSKAGFGDFIGFLVAWGYWISIWVSNAGLAIAIIGGLSVFFPVLNDSPFLSVSVALGFIWFFTWINSKGVKESGRIQVITTVLKLLPLVFIIIVGAFFFSLDNFPNFNLTGNGHFETFPVVAALTLYAFLGVESATIPAENVRNPEKNVPRATMIGTIITTLVYILGTVVLFGLIPVDKLSNSAAPFAEAGEIIGGEYGSYFVAFGAIISAVGCLNGWTLLVGQLPMAAAKDNMFPRLFKKQNKNGVPILGLIIGSLLTSGILLLGMSDGLVEQFSFVVNLTVLTALIPYLFVSAAYVIVLIEKNKYPNSFLKTFLLGLLGFAYAIWAIFGSGSDVVFYGLILLLLSIPFYLLMKWNKSKM
ncbi:amino acid permease [Urechidicola vernalis]|uniref:Arginine/agmatine antiporter n=1 Tax=Urechidicola vernalis TaxID=3075600 RepID=A0ABU2Y8A3_9FLAO|nr:amino acid permease [Urechidicola sp. P050]MDT0553952.1 amino acid permease [Urechidicola sp. P050]